MSFQRTDHRDKRCRCDQHEKDEIEEGRCSEASGPLAHVLPARGQAVTIIARPRSTHQSINERPFDNQTLSNLISFLVAREGPGMDKGVRSEEE